MSANPASTVLSTANTQRIKAFYVDERKTYKALATLGDCEDPRSFLRSDLVKLAAREPLSAEPEQLAAFTFFGGFLRGLRDNGLGHDICPFVVRASGCLPAPPGPFSRLASEGQRGA